MGDPNYATEGMLAMDRWLAAVEADQRHRLAGEKIIRDRPSDIQDRCTQVAELELVEVARPRHGLQPEGRPDPVRHAAHRRRRGRRDGHQQVHAEAAAAPRLLPDRVQRRPVDAPRRRRSRPVSATGAGRASARRARSRGRPTRTAAATSCTAAGRSARRRRAPAPAGPATRSAPGADRRRVLRSAVLGFFRLLAALDDVTVREENRLKGDLATSACAGAGTRGPSRSA